MHIYDLHRIPLFQWSNEFARLKRVASIERINALHDGDNENPHCRTKTGENTSHPQLPRTLIPVSE